MSRSVLASKTKELKQKGKGGNPNKSEPLTTEEENILIEKGVLGMHSPQALLNKMWLNNTKRFGMRGVTENHNMKWGDVELKKDKNELEFLEFHERDTKANTGNSTHQRPFNPRAYAIPNDKLRCPVYAYKQYELRRPPHINTPESPFYIAICHNRKPDSRQLEKPYHYPTLCVSQ